jgi:hypothetical protein
MGLKIPMSMETGRPEGCRPLWKNLFIKSLFSWQEKGEGDEVLSKDFLACTV